MGVLGVRVRVHAPEHDVLVVLSEAEGPVSLPIVIGPHEGVAIATAQAGMQSPRPGPHDLLLSVLEASEVGLDRVNIIEVRDGTFIAELVLTNGRRVDSRASDAIALALRARAPIFVEDAVIDRARTADLTPAKADADRLQKWLESLDSDDLGKYKM
jgi:bifunctional DNase/RNase